MSASSASAAAAAYLSTPVTATKGSGAPLGPRDLARIGKAGPINVARTVASDRKQKRQGIVRGVAKIGDIQQKRAPAEADSNCSLCTAAAMLRFLTADVNWNSDIVAKIAKATTTARDRTATPKSGEHPWVFVDLWYAMNPGRYADKLTSGDYRQDVDSQFEGLRSFVMEAAGGRKTKQEMHKVSIEGLREQLGQLEDGEYVLGVSMRDAGHWNMAHYKKTGDESALIFYDYQPNTDDARLPFIGSLPLKPLTGEESQKEIMDVMVFPASEE